MRLMTAAFLASFLACVPCGNDDTACEDDFGDETGAGDGSWGGGDGTGEGEESGAGGGNATGGGGSQVFPVAPPAAGVTTEQILGFWTGSWGQMVFQVVDSEIRGAYGFRDGTVVLNWNADGSLRGWWCQLPTRTAGNDSGEVEFTFVRGPTGLELRGRWRYSATGSWYNDWNLAFSTATPPPELVQRFSQPTLFCRHP